MVDADEAQPRKLTIQRPEVADFNRLDSRLADRGWHHVFGLNRKIGGSAKAACDLL
jgi:hypothetical protein